jgi:hypothetical protein
MRVVVNKVWIEIGKRREKKENWNESPFRINIQWTVEFYTAILNFFLCGGEEKEKVFHNIPLCSRKFNCGNVFSSSEQQSLSYSFKRGNFEVGREVLDKNLNIF